SSHFPYTTLFRSTGGRGAINGGGSAIICRRHRKCYDCRAQAGSVILDDVGRAGDGRGSISAWQDINLTDHAEGAMADDVAMEQPAAQDSTAGRIGAGRQHWTWWKGGR